MTFCRSRLVAAWCLVALLSLCLSYASHRFQPVIEPDSASYLAFDWSTAQSMLANTRTFGFPLFLKVVGAISHHPAAIPVCHWMTTLAAALVFQAGLTAAGYRRFTAFMAASVLMLGHIPLKFGQAIIADSLAQSLAIAATGCFLASTVCSSRKWAWCGLALFTFLCYQTRPSHLFLIPLWPVLGYFIDWLVVSRPSRWTASLRRATIYAAMTVVPFVAFCTLRWAVVGHWGLVSFGGYNMIGIVGQYLNSENARALPEDLLPVAQEMLKRAALLEHAEAPANFLAMERMYNPTVWEVAVPAAKHLYGDDAVVINRLLSRLSKELLVRHVPDYCRWLVWNAVHAVKQVVQLTFADIGTTLLAIILIFAHFISLWRGPPVRSSRTPAETTETGLTIETIRFRESHLLFWTAAAFAAAKILLVILVEPAIGRYMCGAMSLIPAAMAVYVAYYVETVFNTDYFSSPAQVHGSSVVS